MENIIELKDYFEEPDIATMEKDSLRAYLRELQARIRDLDSREPRNMNSVAYEEWADQHEELEDLVDEVLDRLDELG